MSKTLRVIIFIALFLLGAWIGKVVAENAITDGYGVPSMLGDYSGTPTRVKVDANGYLLMVAP